MRSATNLHRRHLTGTQRAVVAAEAIEAFAEEARERQHRGLSADGSSGGRGRRKPSGQSVPKVSVDDGELRSPPLGSAQQNDRLLKPVLGDVVSEEPQCRRVDLGEQVGGWVRRGIGSKASSGHRPLA